MDNVTWFILNIYLSLYLSEKLLAIYWLILNLYLSVFYLFFMFFVSFDMGYKSVNTEYLIEFSVYQYRYWLYVLVDTKYFSFFIVIIDIAYISVDVIFFLFVSINIGYIFVKIEYFFEFLFISTDIGYVLVDI